MKPEQIKLLEEKFSHQPFKESVEIDHLKFEDLLKEVQYLRMENEYLKKLNALVQERIKQENKKK